MGISLLLILNKLGGAHNLLAYFQLDTEFCVAMNFIVKIK